MLDTEKIWEDYHGRLHGFILARVNEPSIAEDILQDVFVKIHANIDSLSDESRLNSWVYRIAHNTVTDHFRNSRPETPLPDSLLGPDTGMRARVQKDYEKYVCPIADQLPDMYREAILLAEGDNLSMQEVAAQLDISLAAAKSRVQRARMMVRNLLLQYCEFEFDEQGNVIDYDLKNADIDPCFPQ